MNKYGIEHFHIEEIEETDNPEEREVYWIEQLDSFKKGYNATLGGDGKPYLDRDLIIAEYNKIKNITKVAEKLNVCEDSIRNILQDNKIEIKTSDDILRERLSKPVNEYNYDGELIGNYESATEAAKAITASGRSKGNVNGIRTNISRVCSGKRKSAYGSLWKFVNT